MCVYQRMREDGVGVRLSCSEAGPTNACYNSARHLQRARNFRVFVEEARSDGTKTEKQPLVQLIIVHSFARQLPLKDRR